MTNLTQTQRLLKLFRQRGNKGVANYEFYQTGILRSSARIAELRQDGFNIMAVRQSLPNGRATNVWKYFLLEEEDE